MLNQIRKSIDREVDNFADAFKQPPLSAIPSRFSSAVEQFIRRKGKRLRSVLFVIGYRAYSTRKVRHLYRSAAALELLHDFILIHDDLIDHSALRRGGASMHRHLDELLAGHPGIRFKGSDLALIVGDMVYAMAIRGFLAVSEAPDRKQRALEMLTETALFTGCGELDELLHTLRPLDTVEPKDIYRIYDWKTGHYTFSTPLAMGATLGGASKRDVAALMQIGVYLGRAFQIKDDLLDLYGDGDRYGKPGLIDIREGKKTLPVWYAYQQASTQDRAFIRRVIEQPGAKQADIRRVAALMDGLGAGRFALQEVARLLDKAVAGIRRTRMKAAPRDFLIDYAGTLLSAPQPTL